MAICSLLHRWQILLEICSSLLWIGDANFIVTFNDIESDGLFGDDQDKVTFSVKQSEISTFKFSAYDSFLAKSYSVFTFCYFSANMPLSANPAFAPRGL